jgi:hypothetical protein
MEESLGILQAIRTRHSQLEVFAPNREVSIFAHNEKDKGQRRFGKNELFHQIERITENRPQPYHAPDDLNNVQDNRAQFEAFKKSVIDHLVSAPPGRTFIFDGHGSDDSFAFSGGEDILSTVDEENRPYRLNAEEVAQALLQRYENNSDRLDLMSQDIFLFDSCSSGTFIKEVSRKLGSKNIFIFISSSEYFLPSFSDPEALTGTAFMDKILSSGQETGPVFLRDILDKDRQSAGDSSSTILVPNAPPGVNNQLEENDPNNYIQIGMHQRWKSQDEIIS